MRISRTIASLSVLLSDFTACVPATFRNKDPGATRIVSSDIANFWRAYDEGGREGSAAPLQHEYLDLASPGLKDYIGKRPMSAQSLGHLLTTYPRYYAGARSSMSRLATDTVMQSRIRAGFARLEELYGEASFPDVTFVVARLGTGGTVGASGLLIGTEFFTAGPDDTRSELPALRRAQVSGVDSLPFIVAHERIHVQQFRAHGLGAQRSLLEQSLTEGIADFVGELVSGGNVNGHIHRWAQPREAEVWQDFQRVMMGTDVHRWLYNQADTLDTRPGDRGYYIGYRVAQTYYDRQADKREAVRHLVQTRDARALLVESGYDPR